MSAGRSLLPATLSPMVALLVWSRYGEELQGLAETYVQRGDPALARQLLVALGQMRAAAAQLSNEAVAAELISVDGNAETEIGAGMERSELTTAEAAGRLGLTRERVVQLLNQRVLLGRKVGRAWLVDAGSVDDLIEARRAA